MTKNRSAALTTTPPSRWAGATRNWSAALRCLSATAGTRSRQLALVHSQRRAATRPIRSRFHVRRASRRANGLERTRSRAVNADGCSGWTLLGADTPPPRGNATAGTSIMAPPVIERTPTTRDGSAAPAPTRTPVGGHFAGSHGVRLDERSAAPDHCGAASRNPTTPTRARPGGSLL